MACRRGGLADRLATLDEPDAEISDSASVSVAMKSISATWASMSVAPRPPGFEKWLATLFLIERALPTSSTLPFASRKM